MSAELKHVAIFGGTFNPIHKGHLAAAGSAADMCNIDKIWFVPSFLPPHRDLAGETPAIHRFEMVRLACESDKRFFPSEVEIRRQAVSYTIDTVRHFIDANPPGTRISFLIGTDAFAEIDTWYKVEQLFGIVDFLVLARPGVDIPLSGALPEKLAPLFSNISDETLLHKSGKRSSLVKIAGLEMSSSGIRSKIADGLDVNEFVPAGVAEYIRNNLLYSEAGN